MADTMHALVVEDSPTMRQLIVFALSRIKVLKVVEADDGVDALKKLSQQHFDILITDINMPMMDGLKLITALRQGAVKPDVPIVVITTESADADRERAMTLGASAYLIKPVQAKLVLDTVKQLLKA